MVDRQLHKTWVVDTPGPLRQRQAAGLGIFGKHEDGQGLGLQGLEGGATGLQGIDCIAAQQDRILRATQA